MPWYGPAKCTHLSPVFNCTEGVPECAKCAKCADLCPASAQCADLVQLLLPGAGLRAAQMSKYLFHGALMVGVISSQRYNLLI